MTRGSVRGHSTFATHPHAQALSVHKAWARRFEDRATTVLTSWLVSRRVVTYSRC